MLPDRRSSIAPLLLAALLGLAVWGCGRNSSLVTGPATDGSPGAGIVQPVAASLASAMRAQQAHTADLMRIPGVVGAAVTADDAGKPAILVMTENALAPGRLPAALDGYAVIQEVTGRIVALAGRAPVPALNAQVPAGHTSLQTPPIELGTSGGSVVDLANGYCCSGTLGSLVEKNGTQYILSNSHVLAGDVVPGGNNRVSRLGDDIMQPGYVDNECHVAGANIVANLSSLSTLYPPGSTPNVDCAIAAVRSGKVRADGAILEIGTISSVTLPAAMGMAVKKSGRTSGLTRSHVRGLNATVQVVYETECAGTEFVKTFTGQIVVANRGGKFLIAGDSGSLMVEDAATNPRPVGLLYAASKSAAIASPIDDVLGFLGARMVGR